MSGHSDHGHGHGHGEADGGVDDVDYGKVIGVGVGSLVLFAISIWWASTIWRHGITDAETQRGRARPVETHRTEIGIVDQVPFAHDDRLHVWRAGVKHELETYSWVDQSKGVVRIPIEEAMAKVVGGAMPAGAPK